MDRSRKPWLRGALTLGVVSMFGAGMLVSNVVAVPEKQEASKKFVKKRIKRAQSTIINQVLNQTIAEDELIRYSVRTDVAGADTTIATIGNFTFKANCQLDGDSTIIGRVLIETSADNAAFVSDDADELDFDTSDNANPEAWIGGDSGDLVGDSPNYFSDESEGSAVGPTGTTVEGEGAFFSNVAGFDCTLEGYLLQTNA